MIEFSTFSFQYKSQTKPTLDEINLRIRDGEKILIAGASGSGKSTLGSCINGLIPHSLGGHIEGSLKINGVETKESDIYEISREVGTVLQDTDSQFVGLTVGEDIAFSLENQCIDKAKMHEIVMKSASLVSMQDFLDNSPEDLSGGQKQRVALSGVLVDDVSILLFDEPLAALDPATGELAIELIDDLHKQTGKTVIIIEHRIEDVLHRDIDRIVLVDEGRIVMDDTPAHVLQSGILVDKGIREPLYVAAMKNAGCDVSGEENLDSIERMDISPYRDNLLKWFSAKRRKLEQKDTPAALSFRNVSFSYDGRRNALNNISFDVHRGEMISILGKNGAGKSTLASVLTGIYSPDSGQIFIDGKDASRESIAERAQKIGYVMQNPNHMISNSMIYDEVAFGLRLRGVDEDTVREKVMDVLKLCSLAQYHKWPISALSYGQKKRVTIASILVMEPEILILDEPTAGQDYRRYSAMMSFLSRVNRETGVTILFVTHDLHLALEYTPRSIVLADGQLLCDAPISTIFSDEDLLRSANLKVTSLFTLARKLGLEGNDVASFIETFIVEEKHRRGEAEAVVDEKVIQKDRPVVRKKEEGEAKRKQLKFDVEYFPADSWVHRLNGVTKFGLLITWLLVSLMTFDVRVLSVTLVAGLLTLATCHVPIRKYRPILIFVFLSVLLNALFIYLFSPQQGPEYMGSRTILFNLPDTHYTPTAETLWYLLIVVMKYFSISPIAITFIYCTQPSEFASSLNRLRISYKISYAVSLAFRYIPVIMKDYTNIRDSQACRGVEISRKAKLSQRISGTTKTLAPLILSSIDKIDIITNAMILRGFGKKRKRTWYRADSLRTADWILIVFMAALIALTVYLRFGTGVKFFYPF